jgi:hypothetical protein
LDRSAFGTLGRLGLKEEPAGKIRVFAIVDCWTQWLFYPLHRAIFVLLSFIEQDGTFDQSKPIHTLLNEMEKQKLTNTFCYDLSAATDRLPAALQVRLLSFFLGDAMANAWIGLLTMRGYQLPKDKTIPGADGSTLYYGTGQPMGALTSWAMLALTHHCIVQWSWWRVVTQRKLGYTWFTLYAILGDDIVIADKAVAREYLNIMEELGVGIGLAKSLISSSKTIEFAKRF